MPSPGMYGRLGKMPRHTKSNRTVRPPTSGGQASRRDWTEQDGSGGTLTQDVPTVQIDDLLLWWVQTNGTTHTTPTGWTLLDSEAEPDTRASIFFKVADGTEGATQSFTLGASVHWYGVMMSIAPGGVDFTAHPPEGSITPGNSLNPPAVSPSAAPNDYLVFAALHWMSSQLDAVPSGYTAVNPIPGGKQTTSRVVVSEKLVSIVTSEDPGAFSHSNSSGYNGTASTVAVLAASTPELAAGDHVHTEDDVSDIDTLTAKASPVNADRIKIYDSEAADVYKYATLGDLPGGGVTDHGALTGLADDDHTQYLLAAGTRAATFLEVSGLSGATASSPRFVGGTLTGAPASGTFALGDYVVTEDGNIYVCTAAGTPGTWTAVGAGAATDAAAIHDNVAGEISALTLVTAVSGDHILIEDASDSNNKKRVAASDFLSGGGGIEIGMRATIWATDTPTSQTNWNSIQRNVAATHVHNMRNISTGTQNATITYSVFLTAGTYSIQVLGHKDSNRGIFHIDIDAAEVGTVDAYNATGVILNTTVTGVVVGSSGLADVTLTMATKNASSSSYFGDHAAIHLIRTA